MSFNRPLPQAVLTLLLRKIKVPRQTTRDFNPSEVFRFVLCELPSCLAVCFAWPQVALTHHVFQWSLYPKGKTPVKISHAMGR